MARFATTLLVAALALAAPAVAEARGGTHAAISRAAPHSHVKGKGAGWKMIRTCGAAKTGSRAKHSRRCPSPDPTLASRPFSPSSFWNTPLGAHPALDPMSATYVGDLRSQLTQALPWINTTRYSTPVYTVPAGAPTVGVTLDKPAGWDPDLRAAIAAVPIPQGAQPAAGTDETMVVWQPSTDSMWEFWQMRRDLDGWHAKWGGRIAGVSRNPGYYRDNPGWGAGATSLPWLGGLIRMSELRAGHISHALAIAIPQTRAGWYSWPAMSTDGNVDDASAIPEGTRLRLDPTLDIAKLGLPPVTRMIAEAAQRYGMVVRDRADAIAFYAEDPTPTGSDPYSGANGFFKGASPDKLLARFPWSRLQVLKTQLARDTQ